MWLAGIYFIYSALVEERNLTEQFPGIYPAYRRSTKMLVPFIFQAFAGDRLVVKRSPSLTDS